MMRSPKAKALAFAALGIGLTSVTAAQWPAREIALCASPGSQANPALAADLAGGAWAAWSDARSGNYDVYFHHVTGPGVVDGTWPAGGRALCAAPGDQAAPAIVEDGRGGAIVAWYDQRGADHDVYAQRLDARGKPAWLADGVALCRAAAHQHGVALVSDGEGGAIVTWFDHRGGAEADIYAQRVLATGVVDPRWPADGLAVCVAPGGQYFPRPVSDGRGGAIIAWYDHRAGHYDVYAQRVLASGELDRSWPANGVALCVAAKDQRRPMAAADGLGGAFVVWEDMREDSGRDLYAQRVLASGKVDPTWPEGGLAVCKLPGTQRDAALAGDSSGVTVAWEDGRGADTDIYCHRITHVGLDQSWPAGGRAVCTAAGEQGSPTLVADGGGWIVAWQDLRGGEQLDLYAARVLATSDLDSSWTPDGRVLCSAPGQQTRPALVIHRGGGMTAVWEDGRSGGDTDLYGAGWGGKGVSPESPR